MENRKNTIITILIIVCAIVGVFLIIGGILVFSNESFNNLMIKIISFVKHKSPYLLIEGKPVYIFWLIKLISLAKHSIIIGISITFICMVFYIDKRNNSFLFLEKWKNFISSKSRFFYFFVVVVSIVSMLLIIILGFFTWPVADDFGYYTRINESGVFKDAWNIYLTWGGRFFVFLLYTPLFKIFEFNYRHFIVMINACFLIITGYILKNFLTRINYNEYKGYYNFSSMTCVLWLGLTPIISEVVYWAVGGLYIFTSLFIILWINIIYLLIFKIKNIKYKYFIIPILMFFSFFVGGANQAVSPALIFLVAVMLILFRKKYRINRNIVFAALFFLILGTIIMLIAPGNYVRAGYSSGSFNLNFINILKNYINIFVKFTNLAKYMIVLSMLGGFCSAIIRMKSLVIEHSNVFDYIKSTKNNLMIIISFMVASLITILPFTLVSDFTAPRTSIYYIIFLLVFFWGITDYFSIIFIKLVYERYFCRTIALSIIPIVFFTFINFGVITLASENIYYGYFIRHQMIERHEYLSNLSNEEKSNNIVVKPIDGKIPELIHFNDITSDKENWINKDVANLYKLESIELNSNLGNEKIDY